MENFEENSINNENIEEENLNESEELMEEADEEEETEKTPNWKTELFDWIKAIAIAFVVALLLKNFVLTLAKVDGASMEPTLQHADRLYVNKLFYTPEKGDVVIVETDDPSAPFYIKRVVAVEGDTLFINFATGDVFVNGEIIDEPYVLEDTHLVGTYIADLMQKGEFSLAKPLLLGEDEVFVMGDNRNNSKDSREIGPVSEDDIVGHAVFRFWPLNNMSTFDYDFPEE